jgi:hypothetical protein
MKSSKTKTKAANTISYDAGIQLLLPTSHYSLSYNVHHLVGLLLADALRQLLKLAAFQFAAEHNDLKTSTDLSSCQRRMRTKKVD